jgi:hypothetical protein
MHSRAIKRRHKLIAQPTAKVNRRRYLEVANQIATECDWRGEIARAGQDVIDIDDCNEVYCGDQR